jgi:hypothetical protein
MEMHAEEDLENGELKQSGDLMPPTADSNLAQDNETSDASKQPAEVLVQYPFF